MINVDYSEQSPVILSLCPGMRGLERGAERAFERLGWQRPITAAYVEIEAFIIQNLVGQMEQGLLAPAPIWSNIKTAPWEVFRRKIDFIFGGYPCQPFSVAGQGKGVEDPRHLWPYIAEGIRTIRPVGCFFENVRNHLNIGYEAVRAELQEMGYSVREGIYSAEEVGAPHRRERLFILAIQNTNSIRRDEQRNVCQQPRGTEPIRTSENGSGVLGIEKKRQLGNPSQSNKQRIRLCEEYQQGEIRGSSGSVADAVGIRIGESSKRRQYELPNKNAQEWPVRPGQTQREWEPPRTKPRMGFMLNGYSYREDLLRMAGNGVVEQTAELAFIDLLRKLNND